ncbi:MAG: transposase [Alphaproteobacteria bacterium]|nr:transposase [Alphaproteobacteria bacterium]
MLKVLILQARHNLSDKRSEEALRVRLDFIVIADFVEISDHTTFFRF